MSELFVVSFYARVGDTGKPIEAYLTDADGDSAILDGDVVTFQMANAFTGVAVVLTGVASVVSFATGQVRFTWGALDLATAGLYRVSWKVVRAGKAVYFPSSGYNYVQVAGVTA